MIKSNLILSLLLILTACLQNEENIKLTDSDQVTLLEEKKFNTGFQSRASIDKTYIIDDEEFIEYENTKTHKKIVLHSLTSKLTYEIPVHEILKKNEKILHFDILNLDTILIISAFTNNLYFINHHGALWKTIDLDIEFSKWDNKNYKFEIGGVKRPFMFNDTSLIVNVVPYLQTDSAFTFQSHYAQVYSDSLPYLFKIDNIFNRSLNSSFGLYDFYQNFSTELDFAFGRSSVSFGNNKILVKECFSEMLYVINPELLTIEKEIRIQSKFYDSKISTPMVALKDMDKGFDLNTRINESPLVNQNICFSEQLQKYFLGISIPNANYLTLCVYDSSFQKTDEIQFDKKEYNTFKCLTEKGEIIISDYGKYEKEDDYFTTNSLSIFKYDEK